MAGATRLCLEQGDSRRYLSTRGLAFPKAADVCVEGVHFAVSPSCQGPLSVEFSRQKKLE